MHEDAPSRGGRHLRDYQADVKDRVLAEFEAGKRSAIIQIPTGGGKTKTVTALLRDLFDIHPNLVVGWMVHTKGLRTQAADEMNEWDIPFVDWTHLHHARRHWRFGRVHAFGATMQIPRMINKARTLLIHDECHRSAAETVARHINHPRWHNVIGLSGTPARLGWPDRITESHARFCKQWDTVVCGPSISDLVKQGALADVVMRSIYSAGGDRDVLRDDQRRESGYTAKSEAAFEATLSLDAAVNQALALSPRPTIWFSGSQRSAIELGRMLPRSAVVISTTAEHDRQTHYQAFRAGRIDHIISVGVLVEGVDLPNASRVMLLRPSSSRVLLAQMCGRGMRPPGNVEIFDFARSLQALGAHPLDDLPWREALNGTVPNVSKSRPSKPKTCPTPKCGTMLGPLHGRLCPVCSAEIGRWCVACHRSLTGIEDGTHRRCKDCASEERAIHARWAEENGSVPVIDRDAADDMERPASSDPGARPAVSAESVPDEQASLIAILDQQASDLEKAAREARSHAERAKITAGAALA